MSEANHTINGKVQTDTVYTEIDTINETGIEQAGIQDDVVKHNDKSNRAKRIHKLKGA